MNKELLTLDANPSDAPCCVKLTAEDGASILFQQDWDWPSVAGLFGWSPADVRTVNDCQHDGTDGTVKCPQCGLAAGEFIKEARDWIDEHDGETCENPGYELEGGERDEETEPVKCLLEMALWDTGDHCEEDCGMKLVFRADCKFDKIYWDLADYVVERKEGPVLYLMPRKTNDGN